MKVIKVLTSIILTLVVIPIMIAFIVYLSANAIVSKNNIEKMVKEVNASNFLLNDDGEYNELGKDIRKELVDNGLPEEIIDEFIDSKEITEFVSDYVGDIADYIINGNELRELKADDISELINNNVDTIVKKLRDDKVDGYENLTDERVAEFKSRVGEVSVEIEKSIPDLKSTFEESDARENVKIIRYIFSTGIYLTILGVIVVLLVSILLLNLKNYAYLIWFGVIFIISSLPFVVVTEIIRFLLPSIDNRAVDKIIGIILSKISLYSFGFLILGIISLIIATIFRVIDRNNKES